MIHVYTYGPKSRQFLILTPAQARTLDLFTARFFDAQKRYLETYGRRWTPNDTFTIDLPSREWSTKYNKLVRWINVQHKIRNWLFDRLRINVMNEDMDDFLLKRF